VADPLPIISSATAQRLFLGAQGLLEDPARRATTASLQALIERLGFVQVDTINVVARAHDLTLFSRLEGYRPELLRKLLEGKRDIPVKLWVAPPTKMDQKQLTEEGHYGVFGTAGARTEMPGCSLCMGNQAQVREGATVMSTSTRNFPNRLGKNTNVYLGSAELAAICSRLGKIPTKDEYMADMGVLTANGDKIYQYMNFDQIEDFKEVADTVQM